MKRRAFIAALGGAAAWPRMAGAQQQGTMPVFGILLVFRPTPAERLPSPLALTCKRSVMSRAGTSHLDFRYADGKAERLSALATELVAQRPSVIATSGTRPASRSRARRLIPIVSMSEIW